MNPNSLLNKFIFLFYLLSLINGIEKTNKLDSKITGGYPVKTDEFSFVTRIIFKLATHCSGGLINDKWVLTAASCIPNKNYPGDIVVEVDRKNLEAPGGETIEGKTVEIHPKFVKNRFARYDLALLELSRPIKNGAKFKYLELADDGWPQSEDEMYNRKCVVAGFGALGTGRTTAMSLTAVKLTLRHGRYGCRCYNTEENQRTICSNEKKEGICTEDFGAPLICNNKGYGIAHMMYEVEMCNPIRTDELKNNCRSKVSSFMYICPELVWISSIVDDIRIPRPPSSCKGSRSLLSAAFLICSLIIIKI